MIRCSWTLRVVCVHKCVAQNKFAEFSLFFVTIRIKTTDRITYFTESFGELVEYDILVK